MGQFSRSAHGSSSFSGLEQLKSRRLLSSTYFVQLANVTGTRGSTGCAQSGQLEIDADVEMVQGWAKVQAENPVDAVHEAITGVISVDTTPKGVLNWIRQRLGDNTAQGRTDTYDFDDDTHGAFRVSADGTKITIEDVRAWGSPVTDDDYNDRTWTVRIAGGDLDADSINDNGFGLPDSSRTSEEDEIENDDDRPGKIIAVNDDDSDGDGIIDWADGFNRDGLSTNAQTKADNSTPGEQFARLAITLPPGVNPAKAKLRLVYDDSDPMVADRTADQPPAGSLHLWRHPGQTNVAPENRTTPATRKGASIASGGDFIPDGTTFNASAIKFSGQSAHVWIEALKPSEEAGDLRVTVEVDPDGTGPAGFVETDALRLTAALVNVRTDLDRNGEIGTGQSDLTSKTKPFRFWINNDGGGWVQSGISLGGGAADVGGPGDGTTARIGSEVGTGGDPVKVSEVFRRDLEDFAQVGLRVSESIWAETQKVFVSIRAASNPQMSLRLSRSERVPGSAPGSFLATDHVSNLGTADAIVDVTHNFRNDAPESFAKIDAQGTFEMTRTRFAKLSGISAVSPTERQAQLMFEGISGGTGELVFAFANGDSLLAESVVRLDLRNMTDLYEHHTIAYDPRVGSNGDWSSSGTGFDPKVSPIPASPQFVSGKQAASFATEPGYLLFVHGWNMSTTDRLSFAGSAYRRLYWQGYQGTVGLFSWPTQITPDPAFDPGNFNRSEEVAWNSARGLLNHLTAKQGVRQDGGKLTVLAHSMGGIVTSEALALAGGQSVADTVILTQAAVASELYQGFATSGTELYPAFGGQVGGTSPRFGNLGSAATKLVNFNNEVDYALQLWVANTNAKPGGPLYGNPSQPGFGGAIYDGTVGPPVVITRNGVPLNININAYEMFAHGFHAPSSPYVYGAIGAMDVITGPFSGKVNLRGTRYGFTDSRIDHSGQFNHSNIEMGNYWDEVMKQGGH